MNIHRNEKGQEYGEEIKKLFQKMVEQVVEYKIATISFITGVSLMALIGSFRSCQKSSVPSEAPIVKQASKKEIEPIVATFLGNEKRNYYGDRAPESLHVLGKIFLGSGKTVASRKKGPETWSGAGWTGQPLIVRIKGKEYLIQGSYDHSLRMIDLETYKVVWKNMDFDDVVKGTGTIYEDPQAINLEDKYLILQGSRLGVHHTTHDKIIKSFKGISVLSGKTKWELNSKEIPNSHYSRDVDGSALIYQNKAFLGCENGLFDVFDPSVRSAKKRDGFLQPKLEQELPLYDEEDVVAHQGNIVTESSPCLLGDHIYITAGSGHVYGYNLRTKSLDWDFMTGSDLDGSPVVTEDQCILVSVEKQYIQGKGGLLKLNPRKKPAEVVEWFFPTGNRNFVSWEGGVIGSASVNDMTKKQGDRRLAAFSAIDGNLYVIDYGAIDATKKVKGFDGKSEYYAPKLLWKHNIGGSISTPLIVGNKIIAAGYGGLYLFSSHDKGEWECTDHIAGMTFESTPVVYKGKIYIASRDGYLYCFGDRENEHKMSDQCEDKKNKK